MNLSLDLDFLEIGTSDFETVIQNVNPGADIKGMSIEPISYYLNRLPDISGCIKINCAISNYQGSIKIFYVQEDIIQKYSLPFWVRGCNSVDQPHPSVVKHLVSLDLDPNNIISCEEVPVRTIGSILDQYKVTSLKFLKIDTEGHDCVILNSYLDYCLDNNHYNLLPKYILFESNSLTVEEQVTQVINRCIELGYSLIYRKVDTLLAKEAFTEAITNTYLTGYPDNYNPNNLPHKNTLADSKRWCIAHKAGGITYQYGRYEVRKDKIPRLDLSHPNIKSWISLVDK